MSAIKAALTRTAEGVRAQRPSMDTGLRGKLQKLVEGMFPV